MQSPITLTSRTLAVTGGSQASSTTRASSSSSTVGDVGDGAIVHGRVVAVQQGGLDLHGGHLLSAVAVAVLLGCERQAESVVPTVRRPDLFVAGDPADVVVLDPGQVPERPGDGVRIRCRAVRRILGAQAVTDVGKDLTNPPEGIDEDFLDCGARRAGRRGGRSHFPIVTVGADACTDAPADQPSARRQKSNSSPSMFFFFWACGPGDPARDSRRGSRRGIRLGGLRWQAPARTECWRPDRLR